MDCSLELPERSQPCPYIDLSTWSWFQPSDLPDSERIFWDKISCSLSESHVAEDNLEFLVLLIIPYTGITGVCHHASFTQWWGLNLGLCVVRASFLPTDLYSQPLIKQRTVGYVLRQPQEVKNSEIENQVVYHNIPQTCLAPTVFLS